MGETAALPAVGPLAKQLRQVAQRAAGLPADERRRALELCLAYALRRVERPQVPALLRQVAARFEPAGSAPGARDGGGAPPPGDPAQERLAALTDLIRALAGADAAPDLSPEALLEQVRVRAEAVERAVQQTAQEFFDRLLQALDPEAARAFVGKPGLRPAPLYKAAVFTAYAEKFAQLAEYHAKGRLVRDFRASFKRNVRG